MRLVQHVRQVGKQVVKADKAVPKHDPAQRLLGAVGNAAHLFIKFGEMRLNVRAKQVVGHLAEKGQRAAVVFVHREFQHGHDFGQFAGHQAAVRVAALVWPAVNGEIDPTVHVFPGAVHTNTKKKSQIEGGNCQYVIGTYYKFITAKSKL